MDRSPTRRGSLALVVAMAALGISLLLRGGEEDPYVITVMDYEFAGAQPTIPIGAGRDLMIQNAGRNLHNVTIPALDYSEDVRPGERLTIEDVATRFGSSGTYSLVCLIHQERGMTGSIVIAEG